MDNCQEVECIMKKLGIEHMIDELTGISILNNNDTLTTLRLSVILGISSEHYRAQIVNDDSLSSSPPSDSPPSSSFKINNKEPLGSLVSNINKLKESNPIVTGDSLPPLEAKRQAAEKRKKIVRKTSMPKAWVDARGMRTIDDQTIIDYAEGQGFDWYQAKELFLAFVDYHLSRGSKFVKWNNAFYTWVRNDIKFNGKPTTTLAKNVVGSYQNANPMRELFDD